MPANLLMCSEPRPLSPATPTRIVSLAPSTLPDDFVPAMTNVAPAASEFFKNLRRDCDMVGAPLAVQWGGSAAIDAGCLVPGRRASALCCSCRLPITPQDQAKVQDFTCWKRQRGDSILDSAFRGP